MGKVPTRYWIVVMIFFTTYINYTTRANQSISITAQVKRRKGAIIPDCLKDSEGNGTVIVTDTTADYGTRYDWNEVKQGYILASFFWGHTVGSLPSGFVAEWMGPFWTIFICQTVTAIMNFLCVYSVELGYEALAACRFIMGIMGGFIYPALHVLIARWAPPNEKGRFVGGLMGSNVATCSTWLIVGFITKHVNWYWGYHFLTIQIIVFLLVFWFVVSDSPDKHKWISDSEREYILGALEGIDTKRAIPPYLKIFTSCPFWALTIAMFGNLWGLYMQLTAVPKFLHEVVGFTIEKAGMWASLTQLARTLVGLIFGGIGDHLVQSGKLSKNWVRKSFILISHVCPGIVMILMPAAGCDAVWIMILLALGLGFNGASCVTILQNPQDLSPNFAGSILGLVMTFGATSGFLSPIVTAQLIKKHSGTYEWGLNFYLAGIIYASFGVVFIIFGSADIQPWNEKKTIEDET